MLCGIGVDGVLGEGKGGGEVSEKLRVGDTGVNKQALAEYRKLMETNEKKEKG